MCAIAYQHAHTIFVFDSKTPGKDTLGGGGGGVSIIWLRPVKGNEEESVCHICHVRVNWPVVCLIVIMLAIKQTRWSYLSASVCEKHSSVFHLMPGEQDVQR